MKTILALLLALSACIDQQPQEYDGDCMGNLPNSRTLTINTGDPIPGSLINEIQDVIISGGASAFTMKYPMRCLGDSSPDGRISAVGNPVGGIGEVIKFTSVGVDHEWFAVPFFVGNTITSGKISVYGDGAVDIVADLWVLDQQGNNVVQVASGSLSNVPAGVSWSTITMANLANHVMADSDVLMLKVSNNQAGAGVAYFDGLRVTQFR